MHEASIRDFFLGHGSAQDLDRLWKDAFAVEPRSDGTVVRRLHTTELPAPYQVSTADITALIRAVQRGELSLPALDAICFALEASDPFEWDTDTEDGERVAKALFWLGSPEVNYPLTAVVLDKIAHYLSSGVVTFTSEDLRGDRGPPRIINEWRRQGA